MSDHHKTVVQAVKKHWKDYFKPSSYKVDYRLKSVAQLSFLEENYNLIILDRDCTLHGYHAKHRIPDFEPALQRIKKKSEIVSNSSFEEMLRIRDVFGDLFPVNKLVFFASIASPCLLRFADGKLNVLSYNMETREFTDLTRNLSQKDKLLEKIVYNFRKPNPSAVRAVIDYNKFIGAIPKEKGRFLMVGDRYLTDIVCGNLAGITTALVEPVGHTSEKISLMLGRWLIDVPVGGLMSRLAR
ncbi:HAD hydrolase-like protein [Candidatus Woesearchaeota archaeon]|nr:HAD hydrolase-like protein [Candidatus Woesearchaeota archaeon]